MIKNSNLFVTCECTEYESESSGPSRRWQLEKTMSVVSENNF